MAAWTWYPIDDLLITPLYKKIVSLGLETQCLTALAILPEDLDLIPRTHMVAYNSL